MNYTDIFIKNNEVIYKCNLNNSIKKRLKYALLDYIGVTIAGYIFQKNKIQNLLSNIVTPNGIISPIGLSHKTSLNDACFINGLNAHALDFDDGTNAGIIHLGSPIFSVLLPLAQIYNIAGEKLLKAAILGYEASFTMAVTLQPQLKQRGYHATGVCGILGTALAISHLLDYTKEETKKAFSIAAVSATGTLKVLEDASQLKPYNVAKTSLMALISAQMAKAGFEVADDVLSGPAGYLTQFFGTDKIELKKPLLNGTYAIEKAYIKPYAACRYTHPSIDIAKDLRKIKLFKQEEIKEVIINTYSLAVKKHNHTLIKGANSAKMSIPYNFAVTYLTNKTGMDAFEDDCLKNSEIQKLTEKVKVIENKEMSAAFPKKTIAEVEIITNNEQIIKGKSELPKGEPENPLSDNEIIEKFKSLASYSGKTITEIDQIIDATLHVEEKLPQLLALI